MTSTPAKPANDKPAAPVAAIHIGGMYGQIRICPLCPGGGCPANR